jgi:chromosome segregation ATPase
MMGFFTNSYRTAELSLFQVRVDAAERRAERLKNNYDNAIAQRDAVKNQLTEARREVAALEQQVKDKKRSHAQKQQKLEAIKLKGQQLKREYQQLSAEAQRTKGLIDSKQYQLENTNYQIGKINDELDAIRKKLETLDQILKKSEPQPRYSSTGGTCENGHENCTLLPIVNPGKTELTNEAEIKQYRQEMAKAKADKEQLLAQQNNLYFQNNELQTKYWQLNAELETARHTYKSCQWRLTNQQQEIEENRKSVAREEREYGELLQEESKLGALLNDSQTQAEHLLEKLGSAEYEVTSAQSSWEDAKSEFFRLKERYEDMQSRVSRERAQEINANIIKQMAEEELEREKREEKETLARLASIEVEAEDNGLGGMMEKAAHKLFDYGLGAVHRAGGITKKAKEDLKFIKDVQKDEVSDVGNDMSNANEEVGRGYQRTQNNYSR